LRLFAPAAAAGDPNIIMSASSGAQQPDQGKQAMYSSDYLAQVGAGVLRQKLERHWRNLSSAAAVNFWIEPHGTEQHTVWCVRSSLVRGLPGPLLT
jgi:hypothetical protein